MAAPYIPPTDAAFSAWLLNFSTLLTAAPSSYGVSPADAASVQAQNDAFQPAYVLATDPATRTGPTIAAKDAARSTAEAVTRPIAISIKLSSGVTNEQRADLGLTIDSFPPTPIPTPTTAPALVLVAATPQTHQLRFYDSTTPASKKKPYGVIGLEVRRAVGTAIAVDPDSAAYLSTWGKSPNLSSFASGDVGKVATYFGRWVTRSGPGGRQQAGPWSVSLAVGII